MANVKRQIANASKGKGDPVHHPAHYGSGVYETINVIEAWSLGFHLGNAIKYISRAGLKGNRLEDLRKAAWYLNREIEMESLSMHVARTQETIHE